jgi:hypothetical protein
VFSRQEEGLKGEIGGLGERELRGSAGSGNGERSWVPFGRLRER